MMSARRLRRFLAAFGLALLLGTIASPASAHWLWHHHHFTLIPMQPTQLPTMAQPARTATLQTLLTGNDKCLNIISNGTNHQVSMAACENVPAQFWQIEPAQSGYYRMKTQLTGDNQCLDIVNDGQDNQLMMAACGNFSGQFWRMDTTATPGLYRLRTMFTGNDKCLDIINNGANNQLNMAACGNFSGQFWHLDPKA